MPMDKANRRDGTDGADRTHRPDKAGGAYPTGGAAAAGGPDRAAVEPRYDLDMIVTWGDCDAAGISYYAKSFDWFTNARMQFLAAHGFPYMDTFHHAGISLVCLTAECQYKRMLKPEERIEVRVWLTTLTRSRLAFTYRIYKRSGELAAEGKTTHAYVGGDGLPCNLEKRQPALWQRLTERRLLWDEEAYGPGQAPAKKE